MFRSCASLTVLLLLALAAPGQFHSGGWIFTGTPSGTGPALGRIDMSGRMTTLVPQSALSASTTMEGGVMHSDNGHYVVAVTSKLVHQSLLLVDLNGVLLRTLQVSPNPPAQGGYVNDVAENADGDFIVVEGPGGAPVAALYKLDQTLTLTTLHFGFPLNSPRGVTVDLDTGDFIVLDSGRLHRVAYDGSSITSVGTFRVPVLSQVTQDPRSGDFFVGSNLATEPGAVIARMTPAGTASTFLAFGFGSCTALAMDRGGAAAPRLALGTPGTKSGVFFVDLATKAVTTLTAGGNYRYTHLWPDRGRNVSTSKTATGKWAVNLDFPGASGKAYVAGLSLGGTRPGVTLPDGRHLCFNPDPLTVLSIHGLLGPLFPGWAGNLDASGQAAATVDVSAIPGLKGTRLWIQALTLDPGAPLGIATVPDPVVLVL
jgi:hypothetical protein